MANKRVKQKADCSFVNGGIFDEESAQAAFDLGDGRVAQPFSADRMLIAECATGNTAMVLGKVIGETTCGSSYQLSPFLYPEGNLRLDGGSSLDDFIEKARANGFDVFRGPFGQSQIKRDQFDELCGCKLFYPEIAAALN
jgi:hypothetical protein